MEILSWLIYALVLVVTGFLSKRYGEERLRKAFDALIDRVIEMLAVLQEASEVIREAEEFMAKLESVLSKAREGELSREDVEGLIKEGRDIVEKLKVTRSQAWAAWEKVTTQAESAGIIPSP